MLQKICLATFYLTPNFAGRAMACEIENYFANQVEFFDFPLIIETLD
jgi:hypothetical protein